MNDPSRLDLVQLKQEMRQLYQNIGDDGALQVLYEMVIGANILIEVISEERSRYTGN
jgi:hypothetical protein